MTKEQAEMFWREFQELKRRWSVSIFASIRQQGAIAKFEDGSVVDLENESLGVGDLTPGVLPMAALTEPHRVVVGTVHDWGRS